MSSTLLQRKAQLFQQVLSQHTDATSPWVQQFVSGAAAHAGNVQDGRYHALAQLYAAMQQQATLLSYMDQFRALGDDAGFDPADPAAEAAAVTETYRAGCSLRFPGESRRQLESRITG